VVCLRSGFPLAVIKAKQKELIAPITLAAYNSINQSKFKLKPGNPRQAWESRDFGIEPDWPRKFLCFDWLRVYVTRVFFLPIGELAKHKPKQHMQLERFSVACRKVITLANPKGHSQYSEPIETRNKTAGSAGKHVQLSHDWFWFYF